MPLLKWLLEIDSYLDQSFNKKLILVISKRNIDEQLQKELLSKKFDILYGLLDILKVINLIRESLIFSYDFRTFCISFLLPAKQRVHTIRGAVSAFVPLRIFVFKALNKLRPCLLIVPSLFLFEKVKKWTMVRKKIIHVPLTSQNNAVHVFDNLDMKKIAVIANMYDWQGHDLGTLKLRKDFHQNLQFFSMVMDS